MAKIDDVAKIAGVSPATVSRVLNGVPTVKAATKLKVEEALTSLAYRPSTAARALAKSKEISLGLVVATFSEPFFMSVAESILDVCQQNKTKLVTGIGGTSADSEEEAVDNLLSHGCKAIVLHSKYLPETRLIQLLNKIKGLVILNRLVPGYEHRCVWLDNHYGAAKMVQHLHSLGHRQFAYINRAEAIDDASDRLAGWQNALASFDIAFDLQSLANNACTPAGGYAATEDLLNRNVQFTGLLCYDDSMAIGAIRALADRNIRVPQQISVIGFNDSYVARLSLPKLTTMHYPVSEMALAAGRLALQLAHLKTPQFYHVGGYKPVVIARFSDTFVNEIAA